MHRFSHHALVAAVVVLALGAAPAAAAPIAAKSADDVVSSMAYNTHLSYADSVYTNFTGVKSKLAELGARHVRESLAPGRPDQHQRLIELANQGTKATLIFNPHNGTPEALLGILDSNVALRSAVGAIEGPNELDLTGGTGWATTLRDYQRRLYQGVRARSYLAKVPVLGPSFGRQGNQSVVGDLSAYLDYGNIHSYPGGRPPSAAVSEAMSSAKAVSGSKPVMSTETGYHDALYDEGNHPPTSARAIQAYMPALFMTYFAKGVRRTYTYELADLNANPSLNMRDRNFGLVEHDFTNKVSFTRLRTLFELLRDPGTPLPSRSFSYSISGGDPALRHVLLHKRNGAFYLALWRDVSLWDPVARKDLYPADVSSTVVLEQPVQSATLWRVERGTTPVQSYTSPTRVTLNVSAHVALLKLVPR